MAEEPEEVDRSGRAILMLVMALHGGYLMTALAEIADGSPGVLSFAGGAAIGGVTPYLLSLNGALTRAEAAWLASTTTWGWGSGLLLAGASDASTHGALWAGVAGQTAGLLGGLLTERLAPSSAGDTLYIDVAAIAGMAGLGSIAVLDQSSLSTSFALLQTGLAVGVLGGALATSRVDFEIKDAPIIGEFSLAGLWFGVWAPFLVANDQTRDYHLGAGALLGASAGFVVGSVLTKSMDLEPDDMFTPAFGMAIGSAIGGGTALRLDADASARGQAALLLWGGALGVGLTLTLAPDRKLTIGERTMVAAAMGWGLWQGVGLSSAANDDDQQIVGAALLGLGAFGAIGGAAAHHLRPSASQVAIALSGGAWAGWLSGWTAYIVQKRSAQVTDDDVLLAAVVGSDVGLLLGGLAVSPWLALPEARLGWINLFGALGMGIGTSIAAVSGDDLAEGNVAGTAAGLVASAVITGFVDFDPPAPATGEDADRAFVSDLHPALLWAAPVEDRGKPVPLLGVTGKLW